MRLLGMIWWGSPQIWWGTRYVGLRAPKAPFQTTSHHYDPSGPEEMYGMRKKIKNVEEMPAQDDKLSNWNQQASVFDRISQSYDLPVRSVADQGLEKLLILRTSYGGILFN